MGETFIQCGYCGKRVPKHKAVPVYKRPNFLPDNVDVEFVGNLEHKVYVCISCAKHRGISFANWRRRIVNEDRRHKMRARKKSLGRKRQRKKS